VLHIGDKVLVVDEEEVGDDRNDNGTYPKAGIILAKGGSEDIENEDTSYLVGVTSPPYFKGHCGNENERQLFNWHEKCWWIYNIHLLKVV
jgi:hypothetical protein